MNTSFSSNLILMYNHTDRVLCYPYTSARMQYMNASRDEIMTQIINLLVVVSRVISTNDNQYTTPFVKS
jgi:hypothetical protein